MWISNIGALKRPVGCLVPTCRAHWGPAVEAPQRGVAALPSYVRHTEALLLRHQRGEWLHCRVRPHWALGLITLQVSTVRPHWASSHYRCQQWGLTGPHHITGVNSEAAPGLITLQVSTVRPHWASSHHRCQQWGRTGLHHITGVNISFPSCLLTLVHCLFWQVCNSVNIKASVT